ncbi:MAG: tetratricopeptide repeat protein [Acidiferrobacterales bacterium]
MTQKRHAHRIQPHPRRHRIPVRCRDLDTIEAIVDRNKADHPDLVASLSNLAAVYDAQGKHAEAAPFHKRAMALLEKARNTKQTDASAPTRNDRGPAKTHTTKHLPGAAI